MLLSVQMLLEVQHWIKSCTGMLYVTMHPASRESVQTLSFNVEKHKDLDLYMIGLCIYVEFVMPTRAALQPTKLLYM
jgi:hypothetical protein